MEILLFFIVQDIKNTIYNPWERGLQVDWFLSNLFERNLRVGQMSYRLT
jgi:hypothetical protein